MAPQYYDMANFPMCEAKRQLERIIAKLQSGKGGNLWSQDIPGSTTFSCFARFLHFVSHVLSFSLCLFCPQLVSVVGEFYLTSNN